MIDPTHDEIDFIRRIMARGGEIRLQGSIKLLKIDRLIPEYVTYVSARMDTGVFTLTSKGLELGSIDRTQISAARWRAFLTGAWAKGRK
jgi:hypothetical protein